MNRGTLNVPVPSFMEVLKSIEAITLHYVTRYTVVVVDYVCLRSNELVISLFARGQASSRCIAIKEPLNDSSLSFAINNRFGIITVC